MRTRSRLLSKRRLQLPTIREGAEETLRDVHAAGHSQPPASPDAYLLSICHLASPTFPAPDAARPDIVGARCQMDTLLHQRLRFLRHGGNKSVTLDVRHREKEEERVGHLQQGERKDWNGGGGHHHGTSSDPLECLYGRQS